MEFKLGKSYTRDEIHNALGGEKETYLPQVNKKIVCGCFSRESNPKAPEEILVGNAPKVVEKAEILIGQTESIPVFLKRSINNWEYVGVYRFKDHSTNKDLILKKERESGREYIAMILYLEEV